MLRGRHRGLPVAIDKAVLLPDETLAWAEEEDAASRSRSRVGRGNREATLPAVLRSSGIDVGVRSGVEIGRRGSEDGRIV